MLIDTNANEIWIVSLHEKVLSILLNRRKDNGFLDAKCLLYLPTLNLASLNKELDDLESKLKYGLTEVIYPRHTSEVFYNRADVVSFFKEWILQIVLMDYK